MELHASTVVEIWESIRDLIPVKQRSGAILSILEILVENDVNIEDQDELKGVDDDMDDALEEVFGDEDEDDDEEF
jgi:hypothetical protein